MSRRWLQSCACTGTIFEIGEILQMGSFGGSVMKTKSWAVIGISAGLAIVASIAAAADNTPPPEFTALFNGKDLSGWKGLVADPPARAKMSAEELADAQKKADEKMAAHWSVKDGVIMFDGFDGVGDNLCTAKDYGDFEMYVDWKIGPTGDSGIYLRGSPQVQIWDPNSKDAKGVGSGGLYNNQKNPKDATVVADKPIGEWNTFKIRMVGDKVTVWLNDQLVADNVTLENYWERKKPIYSTGAIELQSHKSQLYFKNIYIKELPSEGRENNHEGHSDYKEAT